MSMESLWLRMGSILTLNLEMCGSELIQSAAFGRLRCESGSRRRLRRATSTAVTNNSAAFGRLNEIR